MPNWSELIFGSYSAEEIAEAVDNEEWQEFRESLEGIPLDEKFDNLKEYIKKQSPLLLRFFWEQKSRAKGSLLLEAGTSQSMSQELLLEPALKMYLFCIGGQKRKCRLQWRKSTTLKRRESELSFWQLL